MLIFPDNMPEVMRQRRGFSKVQRVLRELRVEHSLLFSARLRLKDKRFNVFSMLSEAMTIMVKCIA